VMIDPGTISTKPICSHGLTNHLKRLSHAVRHDDF
jgi:hypothetical protein